MPLFAVWEIEDIHQEVIYTRLLSDATDIHNLKLKIKNIPNNACIIETQSSGLAQDIFREYKKI